MKFMFGRKHLDYKQKHRNIFFASKKTVYKNAVKGKYASTSRQEKEAQDRNQV
jgi:hypothetical protein